MALLALAIPYHEPWADEAQAWQMARTLPLRTLFVKYIRYEGSPGLWHFLLWILNWAHVSYAGLHWISGAVAVIATSILIFRSPFPRYLKLSLPFTYFLLYQYAVIARSYVLVPLLLYMIALCWRKSPVVLALLLGLIANLSLHMAVISGGLAIVYCIEQLRTADRPRDRKLVLSAALLLSFYAFAIWTAWPPHDLLLSRVRGESRSLSMWAVISLTWGICEPWVLSIPFWTAIALCLRFRRSLFYLLPVMLFAIFSGAVQVEFWHAGLLVPLVICLLWVTWPSLNYHKVPQYELIGRVALVALAGTQILWSGYALAYDHCHADSPDLAASKFLSPLVKENATIAVTFLNSDIAKAQDYDDVGILPYLDRNPYLNQPLSFWWFSTHNRSEEMYPAALRSRPRIVLVEMLQTTPSQSIAPKGAKIDLLTQNGYRLTHIFCGAKPLRLQVQPSPCHLIFEQSNSKGSLVISHAVAGANGGHKGE
jgi:hypothetical protein